MEPVNEFYCIDAQSLAADDLLNALKALTEGRLALWCSVGKDADGKAHAFYFSEYRTMQPPMVLEVGDEAILISTMATRFQRTIGRVRYDAAKQEGVVHLANPKGDLTANTYKFEPLPPFPGRLFEQPLLWSEPIWMASGEPVDKPQRPTTGTPGYDVPIEPGSYIGGFAPWGKPSVDAVREEFERKSTGELTLRAEDGIDARIWFEGGQCVGMVHDTIRGANAEKTWDAIGSEVFAQRRFRINVPRPEHIAYVKHLTNKILGKK